MNVPLLASYVAVVDLFVLLDPLLDSPLFHKMACIGHIKLFHAMSCKYASICVFNKPDPSPAFTELSLTGELDKYMNDPSKLG